MGVGGGKYLLLGAELRLGRWKEIWGRVTITLSGDRECIPRPRAHTLKRGQNDEFYAVRILPTRQNTLCLYSAAHVMLPARRSDPFNPCTYLSVLRSRDQERI